MHLKMFNAVSLACLSLLFLSPLNLSLSAETGPAKSVFARINDQVIHFDEFKVIFGNAVRNKFYHGQVPREELIAFQHKVSKDIVDQILLLQEAEKLGIKPDLEKLKAGLKQYDERYANTPGWKPRSEANQKLMLDRLSQKDILDQMETRVKDLAEPGVEAVKQFYHEHPEKFTEPKRQWVSVILLPVPPSSPNDNWVAAENVAQTLIDRINAGEKFSELAKEFSAHASAINGGDLGYLHQDMLEPEAQSAVDKLEIDAISQPVRTLQGITLFQLNGIKEPELLSFEKVKNRASGLLYRETQEKTWNDYLASLRKSADIFINEDLLSDSGEQ